MYNKNLKDVNYSVISQISNKAKSFSDAVHLEIGDVDYNLPNLLKESLHEATEKGISHYPTIHGDKELIDNILNFEMNNVQKVASDNILITSGGSSGMFLALMAVINPQDKVLIFEPTWSHFREMITILGGELISIPLAFENNYHLTEEILENIPWEEIKLILISSPNNPTGTIYSKVELDLLIKHARKYNIFLLCDQEYEVFDYYDKKCSILPNYELCVVSKSFSKMFSMAGLRLGYLIGNVDWISNIRKCDFYSNMYASSLVQYAVNKYLCYNDMFVEEMVKDFKHRAKLVMKILNKCSAIKCNKPEGAVYLWVDCRRISMDDVGLCNELFEETRIAVVPGSSFGKNGRGFIRVSLGCETKKLLLATKRMTRFFSQKSGEVN